MTSPYAPSAAKPRGSAPLGVPPGSGAPAATAHPMYWRVLRLSAVRPNGWQRAVLVEGMIGIAVILALADVASAWVLLVLPLVSAGIVKAHDYLVKALPPRGGDPAAPVDATSRKPD